MATDPFNKEKERKWSDVERAPRPAVQPYRIGTGLARGQQQAPPQEPAQPTRPRVQLIEPEAPDFNDAPTRRAAGLTRIYKSKDANGNSVYTDQGFLDATGRAAPEGAEQRYYGAQGERIEATDPWQIKTAADQQRRGLGRQLVDARAVTEQDYQNVFDKRIGRNTVMSRAEREAMEPGLADARARTAAAAAAAQPDIGDQIALLRLQMDQQNRTTDDTRAAQKQMYDLAFNDDGGLRPEYVTAELGRLRGQGQEAYDEYFGTPEGSFLRSALDDRLRTAYDENTGLAGNTLRTPGQLRQSTYQNWDPRNWFGPQRYVTDDDELQRGIAAEDVGLTDADLQAYIEYNRNLAARNARR